MLGFFRNIGHLVDATPALRREGAEAVVTLVAEAPDGARLQGLGAFVDLEPFDVVPAAVDASAWQRLAREILAAPVDATEMALAPGEPTITRIEVHHRSPQLTIVTESPWLLALYPQGWVPESGSEPRPWLIRIPAGRLFRIDAGVWHCGVKTQRASRAFVAFHEGTIRNGSSVHDLLAPLSLE